MIINILNSVKIKLDILHCFMTPALDTEEKGTSFSKHQHKFKQNGILLNSLNGRLKGKNV